MTFIPQSAQRELNLNDGELQILSDTAGFARFTYRLARVNWIAIYFASLNLYLQSFNFTFPYLKATGIFFSIFVLASGIITALSLTQLKKLNKLSEAVLSGKTDDKSKEILHLMEQYSGNLLYPKKLEMPTELRTLIK